ncbi:hypothetical protein ASPNIDRAFT_39362 [Aspergillus niger]|uniref:Uncharacterized protein n=1 Tax=Aspergillus niger TaxID=5061 RepID=A0A117E340_ASPNG|nr:hypothetical protein ASPNIDRAFT_39362 [Aspergillus niger]
MDYIPCSFDAFIDDFLACYRPCYSDYLQQLVTNGTCGTNYTTLAASTDRSDLKCICENADGVSNNWTSQVLECTHSSCNGTFNYTRYLLLKAFALEPPSSLSLRLHISLSWYGGLQNMFLLGIIQDHIHRWAVNWAISAEPNNVALSITWKDETLILRFRKTRLLQMPLFPFQTSSSRSG